MRSDSWPAPARRFLAARRRARFRFVIGHVRTWDGMRVIDLGCGRTGRSTTDFAPASWSITGVDLYPPEQVAHAHPGFTYVRASVCDLSQFPDGAFDLAISVGLLEHVTDPADFACAVREIRRIAGQWALVVPYRYAWVEPHYSVPLFPVLPRVVQNALVRLFNLHGHRALAAKDPAFLERRTTWRTNAAYRAALPGSRTTLTPTLETVLIWSGAAAGTA